MPFQIFNFLSAYPNNPLRNTRYHTKVYYHFFEISIALVNLSLNFKLGDEIILHLMSYALEKETKNIFARIFNPSL